ncbi:hypothetical protein V6N13_110969 [Hibiscus sabdariffa]
MALEIIEGKHKSQYSRLYDYLAKLRLSNPSTTTVCKLDDRVFERVYICLQACKEDFKACRPIICLDGCHLKGYDQGHILDAVGIDANDCIYPIAYAVVDNENNSSRSWFLELLAEDLGLTNSYHVSFMTDKQKFILEARDKPIITLLEIIRTKIMERIAKKKFEADKWTTTLCPKIQQKLEATIERLRDPLGELGKKLHQEVIPLISTQRALTQPPAINVVRWHMNTGGSSLSQPSPTIATSFELPMNDQ